MNYVLFKNPVSKATINGIGSAFQATVSPICSFIIVIDQFLNAKYSVSFVWQGIKSKSTTAGLHKPLANAAQSVIPPLASIAGSNYIFVRVAGVSGAAAVCLAAYGKHKLKGEEELRSIYESANNMHLIHSVVLLAVPLAKRPVIVSSA